MPQSSALATLEPLPQGMNGLTDPQSTMLASLHPDLPATPRQCVTCGGTGTFEWYLDEARTEVGTYECPCPDQWLLHRYLLFHGVGLNYQRLSWDDALKGTEKAALGAVFDYLDKADRYVPAGIGFVLHGTKGTGKTLLSTLAVKWLLGRNFDAYFTTFSGLLTTLMDGYGNRDQREWFHSRIKNAGVLVIDDVGREHKQRRMVKDGETTGLVDSVSSVAESALDEVVRARVANDRPTIITTNHDLEELAAGYGSNVMSLLTERSRDYQFTGRDFRSTKRAQVLNEVERGLTRPVVLR